MGFSGIELGFYYLPLFWFPSKRLKCYYTNCFWAVSLLLDPRMTCHFSTHFYSMTSGSCINCKSSVPKVIELFRYLLLFFCWFLIKRHLEYVCLQNMAILSMLVRLSFIVKTLRIYWQTNIRKCWFLLFIFLNLPLI